MSISLSSGNTTDTKLYGGSYFTLGPVSAVMGDRTGVQLPVQETYLGIQPVTQVNSAWPSLRG